MIADSFHTSNSRKLRANGLRGTLARSAGRSIAALLVLIVAAVTNAEASVSVEASVEHPTMTLGQSNSYTVTIRNAPSASRPEPPSVSGLAFGQNASTHNSNRMINGVISRELRFTWGFQAERTGTYVIPAREVQIGGETFTTNEVTVEVGEMPDEMRNRFALRWQVPEEPFYVGQAIPATLQLYVRADINAGLGSHPDGSSDQFLRTEFPGQPRQRQERIDGQTYAVVEWDSIITPIRAGSGDLPIDLVLVYETGQRQRDFFGSRPVQDRIRLMTRTSDWNVLDLPRTGRPESFSGAVGNFDVEAKLSRHEAEVGDPLTLSLQVSGEGNFDRIRAPEFPEADGWRVYPPRTQMEEGGVPYRGVKTFEYILTPTTETVREVPAVAFSWFDPEGASWREMEAPPKSVTIHPSSDSPGRAPVADQGDPTTYAETPYSSLHPIATSPGRPRTLRPSWGQPVFWIVNGGLGCLMAFAFVGLIRNRKALQNPYLQVRSEAARRAKDLATQAVHAAEKNDAVTFYTFARQALRHFLATLDPQTSNPESLTWEDLERILADGAFDEKTMKTMRDLFGRKDAVQFAGWRPTNEELSQDRRVFESLLNQIVSQKR